MNRAPSSARRIAGWTCIALGKIGSLMLLWILVTAAEPDAAGAHTTSADTLFGWMGIGPLLAMTLGAVVIGLWILMKSERV